MRNMIQCWCNNEISSLLSNFVSSIDSFLLPCYYYKSLKWWNFFNKFFPLINLSVSDGKMKDEDEIISSWMQSHYSPVFEVFLQLSLNDEKSVLLLIWNFSFKSVKTPKSSSSDFSIQDNRSGKITKIEILSNRCHSFPKVDKVHA